MENDIQNHISNIEIDTRIYAEPILLVDDSTTCRSMMALVYSCAGFTNILQAKDGKEALEMTLEYKPSLVVLDLFMPILNGTEYTKEIRKNPDFLTLPIIVQSATTNTDDIHAAFNVGVNDFISKPPSADELIARSIVHISNVILARNLSVYKKRMDADMKIARRMQASIMPNVEQQGDFQKRYRCEIGSHFNPSAELGGDFWGMRSLSSSQMALYNIDLSGHGVSAALNTFRFHAILHENKSYFAEPAVCISAINSRLSNLLDVGQYATVFYTVLDVEKNMLSYVLTGAPTPIILSAEGEVYWLKGMGVPVGAIPNIHYDAVQHPFLAGETLLTYSDALIETPNADGIFFSAENIVESLQRSKEMPVQDRVNQLVEDFHSFIGENQEVTDDLTIVIYHRHS